LDFVFTKRLAYDIIEITNNKEIRRNEKNCISFNNIIYACLSGAFGYPDRRASRGKAYQHTERILRDATGRSVLSCE
jgi:hypothetical protein